MNGRKIKIKRLSEIRDLFSSLIEEHGDLECLDSCPMYFGETEGFHPYVERVDATIHENIPETKEYFIFGLN